MGDHRELLNKLDLFIDETNIVNTGHIFAEPEKCCNNTKIRHTDLGKVCISSGLMGETHEIIIKPQFLNPKYQLSTSVGYCSKSHSHIYRLHKWTNYDYRENMANKNYIEIREMGNKLKLTMKMIDNACYIYKTIYINKNTSSRNKIKKSLYIYCLFKASNDYDHYFDIIETLIDNNLSIENYNKALLKVDDDSKLFLNPNMPKQYKKLIDNWDTTIELKDIIIEYNRICKLSTHKNERLNDNSILIGSIYNLLKCEDTKKFFSIYNITNTTIKKFNKIIN